MVQAINRIIGSKIEQRILSDFDYAPPMSDRENRFQWKRKPKSKKGISVPKRKLQI
jgi:hypothetical protein